MKPFKGKEPTKLALALTAVGGIALGSLLSIYILLVWTPAERATAEAMAEMEARPGNYRAYYREGRAAPAETPNLRMALARVERRTPGPVAFTEDEINYFVRQYRTEQVAEGEAVGLGLDQVNFSMVDDRLDASMRVTFGPPGQGVEVVMQAQLAVRNTDNGPVFEVQSFKFNSLPFPTFGGLPFAVGGAITLPEELTELWGNIKEAEIAEGQLRCVVGIRAS